jgi:hypothetical protein
MRNQTRIVKVCRRRYNGVFNGANIGVAEGVGVIIIDSVTNFSVAVTSGSKVGADDVVDRISSVMILRRK